MISFKQLNYALAVEKTLHFKKAAELSHLSQSALSTAISDLENQLGLKIFERDNKKVLITPEGSEILARARNILFEVEALHQLANSQKTPLSFPISVGIIPTVAPYLIPKLLSTLNDEYPLAEISLVEDQTSILVDSVRKGEIDTAIIALPYPCDGLLNLAFWQEDFYWIISKQENYAQQKEVSSSEVVEHKLILLKEGHCLKNHILDVCKFSDRSANYGVEATSLNTLVQMAEGNLGTTLIPAMAMKQLIDGNDKLAAIHLNEPSPHRRIAFIFRPNYTRLSSIEALADICRKVLS